MAGIIKIQQVINRIIETCKNNGEEDERVKFLENLDLNTISDDDLLGLQAELCENYTYEIGEDEAIALFSETVSEFESKYPNDVKSCYANYDLGAFLNKNSKYAEAVLQYQKTLDLFHKLEVKDSLFEAEIISLLADSTYCMALFDTKYYLDFDKSRRLYEEALSLLESYNGPDQEEAEAVRKESEDGLTDVFEVLCDNKILPEWAEKALVLINKKIKSSELYNPQPNWWSYSYDDCIEIYERKYKLLEAAGHIEEMKECQAFVDHMKEVRAELRKKERDEYLAKLVYSDKFIEIKNRGYIMAGDTLDCPEHGMFSDGMRELFGNNWYCQRFYMPTESGLPYDVFCYKWYTDFTIEEEGAKIVQNYCLFNEDCEPSSKKVALFVLGEKQVVTFLGLFICEKKNGEFIFVRDNEKLELPQQSQIE